MKQSIFYANQRIQAPFCCFASGGSGAPKICVTGGSGGAKASEFHKQINLGCGGSGGSGACGGNGSVGGRR